MSRPPVIAIDGPAGSGKSTIAQLIAEKLGFVYVDTGAMYRALTLKALKNNIDLNDDSGLVAMAKAADITLKNEQGVLKVYLDNKEVTEEIRTPEVTNNTAYIASVPDLRKVTVKKQRQLGEAGGVVIEGRDTTTVVFPDADYKFYLDASFDERVNRRHKQFMQDNRVVDLQELKQDIKERDEKDKKRKVGGLKKAPDAIYVDTTNLSIDEVVDKLLSCVKQAG